MWFVTGASNGGTLPAGCAVLRPCKGGSTSPASAREGGAAKPGLGGTHFPEEAQGRRVTERLIPTSG